MNLTDSACVAWPFARRRISSGLLAQIHRVHIDGRDFAIKTFRRDSLCAWANEVASHLTCPQPEVVGITAYGRDTAGAGWLSTPWIDAPDARQCKSKGNATIDAAATAWIAGFQARLASLGFRWVDATPRNLLVLRRGRYGSTAGFAVVDYTIAPLVENHRFTAYVNRLAEISCGQSM